MTDICLTPSRGKISQKFTWAQEETAELTASRDFLLSCFLSCAPGLIHTINVTMYGILHDIALGNALFIYTFFGGEGGGVGGDFNFFSQYNQFFF